VEECKVAFKQGDAFFASIDLGVLKVPMHRELGVVPRYRALGLVESLIGGWLRNRKIFVRVNLGRLASVSYDGNDRSRWFDLSDEDGYSLRLLFSVAEPVPGEEAAVLTALRDHVRECGLKVDLDTRRALGISDFTP
jgi:hypothetical protein